MAVHMPRAGVSGDVAADWEIWYAVRPRPGVRGSSSACDERSANTRGAIMAVLVRLM